MYRSVLLLMHIIQIITACSHNCSPLRKATDIRCELTKKNKKMVFWLLVGTLGLNSVTDHAEVLEHNIERSYSSGSGCSPMPSPG